MPLDSQRVVALVGCPNAGKTALFNRLTGSRQKVANYPGVTVEYKEGFAHTPQGEPIMLVDLPGCYSFRSQSPDEIVTRDVLAGNMPDIGVPDAIICVADATNLKLHLRFALEVKMLGIPMILALNMADIAERRGYKLCTQALSEVLGIPVIETVAVRGESAKALLEAVAKLPPRANAPHMHSPTTSDLRAMQRQASGLLDRAGVSYGAPPITTYKIDRVLMHPVAGVAILLALLFLVFQAVFSWSAWPMDQIDAAAVSLGQWASSVLPEGHIRSFVVDGIIAGIGSVIIFLPQILVLFFFILLLEDSGYMARAAFLLDRLMGGVGLHGRAFIPLLSSFACAIPGIMATRTIANPNDRLTTILVAPLMTCSARIPVYTLIIAAFIPNQPVLGVFNLQGLVMFGLYAIAILSGLLIAFVLKRFILVDATDSFIMELPTYKLPSWRNLTQGLFERVMIFLRRAGTIIFFVMVLIWFISTFPEASAESKNPILESWAGIIGTALAPIFAPIGFNWQMVIALIPGMAAREVAVAVLGTVYAIQDAGSGIEASLAETLANAWTLPAALAFLAWYIFAPQCISTLAVIRRETNSRKWMWVAFAYLTALAYIAAGITYHTANALLN